ncbi:MAG: manganese efflux pump [Coprobacillus sp.]
MHLFSVILFCFVANIDCLIVGISYGLRRVHITILNNIFIGFLSCIGTFISMKVGYYISEFVFMRTANIVGCLILIVIGVVQIKHYMKSDYHNMHISNEVEIRKLSIQEVLLTGIALMLNNLSLGVGASITGMPVILSSIVTFLMSFCFIQLSKFMTTKSLSKGFQKYTTLFSGIVIILLGIWELFI